MNTQRKNQVKPSTTDCFGKLLVEMTKVELVKILDLMKMEKSQYAFHRETIRFQKKHIATMNFVQSLINA
jgi:hypothetical protein